jgi:hypothetical protein
LFGRATIMNGFEQAFPVAALTFPLASEQASMSVPSTVKCSSDIRPCARSSTRWKKVSPLPRRMLAQARSGVSPYDS